MLKTDEPIIVEHLYTCSRESLWNALTDHSEMVQWYFDNIPDFKAEVGFTTKFLIANEGRQFTHCWEVTEVNMLEKLAYKWTFDEYPGASLLTFEIYESGTEVGLRAIDTVLEDFPAGIPEFEPESCRGGWEYFLGDRLAKYLATSS